MADHETTTDTPNPTGRRMKRILLPLIGILIAAAALITALQRNETPSAPLEDNRFLLDTVVTIRLYDTDDPRHLDEAFALIEADEARVSRYREDSETSRINGAAAGTPVNVSADTRALIRLALDYADRSGGAFDPTVGPLVDLWGIGGEGARIPADEEISATLPLLDADAVVVDDAAGTVRLDKDGMILDLGGIAKGWIADRAAAVLRDAGVRHILLNLGGNVLVSGGKPDGGAFRIGMQDPFNGRGTYLGIFSIRDRSVVSSGIYERYFEVDGVRYHHILDTDGGRPVRNELAAVTVLTDRSADGDALSTTVFALGLDDGLAMVNRSDGVEAAFVTRDRRIVLTPGASELFEPVVDDWTVEVRGD